jgi:hypothetical protein
MEHISKQFPAEVLGMSDRIMVMHEGDKVSELLRGKAAEKKFSNGRRDEFACIERSAMENPPVITTEKDERRQRAGHLVSSVFNKYGIFLIFAVMVVVASMLSPAFVSSTNLINVVRLST